jgi:hypothetical protein
MLITASGNSQIFYHKSNDDAAQKALQLSKDASLAGTLDPALKNLDVLEDKEANIEFDNMARTARAAIDATSCWGGVIYAVCTLKNSPPAIDSPCAQIQGKVTPTEQGCKLALGDFASGFTFPFLSTQEIQKRQEELKKSLDDLKHKADKSADVTSTLTAASEAVKQAQDLYDQGIGYLANASFVSSHTHEFQATKDALALLSDDLAGLQAIEKKRKDITDKVKSLSNPLASLESDRLQAELNHIEALLRISRLRDQEENYLQVKIIGTFETALKKYPVNLSDRIDASFANCGSQSNASSLCGRDRLSDLGEALQLYTAALIWGKGAEQLNELRTAREAHRFSIEVSIVDAKAADLVISTGVQRLALYHQGGIKPETLAQLIYAAATIGVAAR